MNGETVLVGGIRVESLEDGAVWRATLATPKANVLDMDKIEALTGVFERAAQEPDLKAVIIDAEGRHFSFGASVPEHLPGRFETMIPAFHGMFHAMLDSSVATAAVVRGQCLGGGLELAAFCHRVFADSSAKLGQPEIVLGVLAPVASVILPERIGRPNAEELLLSGRVVDADEALALGLIDELAEDPSAAARRWIRGALLGRSASSLRLAVRAARVGWAERFRSGLHEAERLYLQDLMRTADAVEGLQAFGEGRDPVWRNA